MAHQHQFRASENRGGADHGWLKTLHTFSFADYYDPSFESFGALRVINEDRVQAKTGFPTHPHREAEIFSYIVSGELTHKDSMGNIETMRRGDLQMTSGGTGIRHSEYNDHAKEACHFLQIWALPFENRLPPKYYTRHFTDDEKRDTLVQIVGPVGAPGVIDEREGKGPAPVHSPLHFLATLLTPGKSVNHTILPRHAPTPSHKENKQLYIQLVQSSEFNLKSASKSPSDALIKITSTPANGEGKETTTVLGEGDGVFIRGAVVGDGLKIENVGGKVGEVVVFDIDA